MIDHATNLKVLALVHFDANAFEHTIRNSVVRYALTQRN